MSDEPRNDEHDDAEDEIAPTPFDGPWFLPLILVALTVWFTYDGWFSTDPDLQADLLFNRVGAVVWAIGAECSCSRRCSRPSVSP